MEVEHIHLFCLWVRWCSRYLAELTYFSNSHQLNPCPRVYLVSAIWVELIQVSTWVDSLTTSYNGGDLGREAGYQSVRPMGSLGWVSDLKSVWGGIFPKLNILRWTARAPRINKECRKDPFYLEAKVSNFQTTNDGETHSDHEAHKNRNGGGGIRCRFIAQRST